MDVLDEALASAQAGAAALRAQIADAYGRLASVKATHGTILRGVYRSATAAVAAAKAELTHTKARLSTHLPKFHALWGSSRWERFKSFVMGVR